MATLYSIIQQHMNVNKILFPTEKGYDAYDLWRDVYSQNYDNPNFDRIIIHLYYQYITHLHYYDDISNKILYRKNKFKNIKNMLDNIFISESMKETILSIFSKTQRTYYAFSKLAYIYRFKKAKTMIKNDLYLNEIDENKTNVYTLFQYNAKYLFVINDLINLINNNLSNSPSFFMDPLTSKNPYNNIPFSDTDLYNIYFFIKNKNGIIPELFHNFFMCNFDVDQFTYDNECLIRNIAIHKYVFITHFDLLHSKVKLMLNTYLDKLYIHEDFPKETLVNIMRPYLHLHYLDKYAIYGTIQKNESKQLLLAKLKQFYRYNPHFGKKKITFVQRQKFTFGNIVKSKDRYPRVITFNDKHINFYTKCTTQEIKSNALFYSHFSYNGVRYSFQYYEDDDGYNDEQTSSDTQTSDGEEGDGEEGGGGGGEIEEGEIEEGEIEEGEIEEGEIEEGEIEEGELERQELEREEQELELERVEQELAASGDTDEDEEVDDDYDF
jgi:hypothetical protein